ncbi:MAG: SIMPL domain-containing protein [Holosporales bacterium]
MAQEQHASLKAAAILGTFLSIGSLGLGYAIYRGIHDFKMSDRYVTVKGLVEREVKSDHVDWDLNVRVSGDKLPELFSALEAQKTMLLAFLQKVGLSADEVIPGSPNVIDTHARDYGGQLPPHRYLVDMNIRVSTDKVDLVDAQSRNLGDVAKDGVAISRSDLRYQFRGFNELRPLMLAEATKSARLLAEQFAADSGSHVGAIRRANQGVFRIMSADALPTEEYDSGQTSLMKKIRVVSTIDFFLVD